MDTVTNDLDLSEYFPERLEQAHDVTMTVNGELVTRTVPVRRLLSDFLRHDLGLSGTHVGCEHGVCGACTILVDGLTMRSCLQFAVQCQGATVTTIEGVSPADGGLNPTQQAFRDCHGLQCGFCTPGFVMAVSEFANEFIDEHSDPVDAIAHVGDRELRSAVAGNLCRCTGYQNIVAATRAAVVNAVESAR